MEAGVERTFLFHADASPLGGVVSSVDPGDLRTVGSSSLAPTGGTAAQSEKPDYERYGKLVAATVAYSEITGRETPAGWTSDVCSTVEHLDLQGLVTAEKIVAHLVVHHPRVGYSPMVEFGGSAFTNLRVNGKTVTPTIDVDLYARKVAPPEARVGSWIDDPEMVGAAVRHCRLMTSAPDAPDWVKARYGWMGSKKERRLRGHVVCSLVSGVTGLTDSNQIGHAMYVPGVGRLVLGELRVDQGSFELTMLRVEMGCRDQGSGGGGEGRDSGMGSAQAMVSAATAGSNGRPSP